MKVHCNGIQQKTEEKLLHACGEEMGSFCVIFQRHHPALIPTLSFACSPFSRTFHK
jgi:hypothetical protein